MKYIIVEIGNDFVEKVIDIFNTEKDAQNKLKELENYYRNDVFSNGNDYFKIESDYGNFYTYQIIKVPC